MLNAINLSIYQIVEQFLSNEKREFTHSQKLFSQLVSPKYFNEQGADFKGDISYKKYLEKVKNFIDESTVRYNQSTINIENKSVSVEDLDEEFKLVLARFVNVVKNTSNNIVMVNGEFIYIPTWYEKDMIKFMANTFKPKKKKSVFESFKGLFGKQEVTNVPVIQYQHH